MENKLLIAGFHEKKIMVGYEGNIPVSIQVLEDDRALVGNIYIGKVKNILDNIGAAFIDIGGGLICYYSMENQGAFYTLRQRPGKLTVGDELVVQVEKDATKTKAPVVKGSISLAGKFLVLLYGEKGFVFSRKITDSVWKRECRELLMPGVGDDFRVIIRTNAYGAPIEALREECGRLEGKLRRLLTQAAYKTCYTQLYQAPSALAAAVRDRPGVSEIVTDCKEEAQVLSQEFPACPLRFYRDGQLPLYKLYSLEKLVDSCLSPRVWLKSGGYLVIEPTEALTVIDVNSGKYIHRGNSQCTYKKMNFEAAEEIARQLRLRNLSGMILADFIDLKKKEDQEELLDYMNRLLLRDSVRAEALDLTKLNLMEIVRKRAYRPFYEQMGQKPRWGHWEKEE